MNGNKTNDLSQKATNSTRRASNGRAWHHTFRLKKLRHSLEFISLYLFSWFLRLLPLSVVRFIAETLADIVFYVFRMRTKVVMDNLSNALAGEKSVEEIEIIARNTYRQFAKTFFEIAYFPRLSKDDLSAMVRFSNTDILDEAIKGGNGAVLVGSHFGNWELMGAALALKYPLTFLVGEQTNAMVDNLLNSYRIMKGVKIIPLKFALRGVMKTLKNNEFVAIISDQDAHENGYFVDFFGRPASTPKAAAVFSIRAGCPIFTGHCVREDNKFHVIFDKIELKDKTGVQEKDAEALTALYTKNIEDYARRFPDHWFWMHKRWKTKPPRQ